MSESGDLLSHKCMKFAIRIVKLYKWLCDEKLTQPVGNIIKEAATGHNYDENDT